MRFHPSARIEPAVAGADARRGLPRREKAGEQTGLYDGRALGGDTFVVECEAAEPALRRRVRRDVHQLGSVAERSEVARLEEARAGVRGLGAVHAVELGGVTDRLVDLQRNLVPVQHDGHHAARALVGAQQRGRLLGDAGRLTGEIEPVDVLPAALAARADVRARIAPHLEDTVTSGGAFDPGAALDQLLFDLRPLRGEQELVLALRTHHRLPDEDVRAGHRFVGFEALRHLLRQRDLERIPFHVCAVRAACRSDGSELARVLPRRGAREGAGSERCVAGAVGGEPPVAGKPPGAVEQHPDADAFALGIGEALDAAALRRDELVPLHHDTRVRVLGPSPGRRIDRGCT